MALPDVLRAQAPGRVELLGNHTDYNEGLVLAAAIDRGVRVAGRRMEGKQVRISSKEYPQVVEVSVDELRPLEGEDAWANYPLGVAWALAESGYFVTGFELEIASTLPAGAGLSSSAALEVATALFLAKLFDWRIEPLAVAKLCRRAENEFVGMPCGLLDQATSVSGRAHHAVWLDCRAETVELVPFPEDVSLLIAQSGVNHELVAGAYAERRAQCFEAAQRLGVAALRDVTTAQLDSAQAMLPELSYRRARHVTSENERVAAGVEALRRGDVAAFGELMFASHESSRVWFENSTPELDALVALAKEEPGVWGSRLTGGGFGGASVSLVRTEEAEAIGERLARRYEAEMGRRADVWRCAMADGASAD